MANNPGSFGYNEATRQFNLPPPSGQPELTLYANRATIDTGVENLSNSTTLRPPPNSSFTLSQQSIHQDITINEATRIPVNQAVAGNWRCPFPLVRRAGFQSLFPDFLWNQYFHHHRQYDNK